MSFTRDWVDTSPIDHTQVLNVPGAIRAVRVDTEDRISSIISGFVSGETAKGVLVLPFIAQSTPTPVAAQFQLYGKIFAGKTELCGQDADGHEIQFTTGGALNFTAAALMALVGPLVYPVGASYSSYVSTNPNTLFGFGTWSLLGAGRIPICVDSGDTTIDTPGKTVGARTVTLTKANIPTHVHTDVALSGGSSTGNGNNSNVGTGNTGDGSADGLKASPDAVNITPPVIAIYIWRRTA